LVIDAHVNLREHARGAGKPALAAEDLLREMDAADVAAAVVVPCPGFASNGFVRNECAAHDDRLFALYNPDFTRPERTLEEMERFVGAHAPHGIKIHPRFQEVSVHDTIVEETVSWASEHGLPVLFDCFPHGDSLHDEARHPLAYQHLARRLPEATIVLAHAGGHRALEAFMVAKANPNIVLESSFTLAYLEGSSAEMDLAFAIRRLSPGRVLYGSDFPEVGVADYLGRTRAVVGALSGDRAEAFYAAAARRVYGIPV
jgi:predicted TIM-barrel fold metal-dependent hydrolase